ncbi:MAG: DUF3793 family protein [Erysipelotrichaceae bacterium]
MSKEQYIFEKKLVNYCAPTLMKQKAGSMFHVYKQEFEDINKLVNDYNDKLSNNHLVIRILQQHQERITLYIYHPLLINKCLKDHRIIDLLKSYDYPLTNIEQIINHLDRRLNNNSYPHEIGVFLGYPINDVLDFINKRPCLYTSYWKVYHNVDNSIKRFNLFNRSKEHLLSYLKTGKSCLNILKN